MRLKNKNNKIFKLQLLKSKFYKIKKKDMEQFEIHFKKILLTIFEFHKNNKKILFIGFPFIFNKRFKKIFTKTKHSLIMQPLLVNNLLINKKLKVNKIPDLIVVFNQNLNISFINEVLKSKVPIIKLNKFNFLKIKKVKNQVIFLFFLFLVSFFKISKI